MRIWTASSRASGPCPAPARARSPPPRRARRGSRPGWAARSRRRSRRRRRRTRRGAPARSPGRRRGAPRPRRPAAARASTSSTRSGSGRAARDRRPRSSAASRSSRVRADADSSCPARTAPVVGRQVVERLDERALVDDVPLRRPLPRVAPRRAAARHRRPPEQLRGPGAERVEVARAEPPGGAGEQPHQRVAARRGRASPRARPAGRRPPARAAGRRARPPRPARPSSAARTPAAGTATACGTGRRSSAARPSGPRPAARRPATAPAAPPRRPTAPRPPRSRATRPAPCPRRRPAAARAAALRRPCRRPPTPAASAAGRRGCSPPRAPRGRCASSWTGRRPGVGVVRGAEVVAEALQVAGGRAAPAVDRLVRVADRGHRVAGAVERAQQHELRVAGVLVLVEQDDAVLRPLPRAHVRHLARDPRGQRHLVAEVDRAELALAPRVRRHDRHQLAPRGQPLQVLEDLRARLARPRLADVLRPRRRRVHDPFQLGGDVVGVEQVLRALAGQVEHGGGHRRRARPRRCASSPSQLRTRSSASCQAAASPSSLALGSSPSRRPWSASSAAA